MGGGVTYDYGPKYQSRAKLENISTIFLDYRYKCGEKKFFFKGSKHFASTNWLPSLPAGNRLWYYFVFLAFRVACFWNTYLVFHTSRHFRGQERTKTAEKLRIPRLHRLIHKLWHKAMQSNAYYCLSVYQRVFYLFAGCIERSRLARLKLTYWVGFAEGLAEGKIAPEARITKSKKKTKKCWPIYIRRYRRNKLEQWTAQSTKNTLTIIQYNKIHVFIHVCTCGEARNATFSIYLRFVNFTCSACRHSLEYCDRHTKNTETIRTRHSCRTEEVTSSRAVRMAGSVREYKRPYEFRLCCVPVHFQAMPSTRRIQFDVEQRMCNNIHSAGIWYLGLLLRVMQTSYVWCVCICCV